MKLTCPLLAVSDLSRTRTFYEQVLGQKVVLDFGANITFDGGFALQTKPSWAQFIDRPETSIAFGGCDFELYFEEEDFDAFLKHFRTFADIDLVHDVREYPWGQHVIRFFDPDRHIIEVGESMKSVAKRFLSEGLSVEETSKRTQHPLEFVQMCQAEML